MDEYDGSDRFVEDLDDLNIWSYLKWGEAFVDVLFGVDKFVYHGLHASFVRSG